MLAPLKHIERDAPITCGVLIELRDYWNRLRGDRRMPARQDIDPVDIPRLLRHLAMADVFADPKQDAAHPWAFRYRLIGTKVVGIAGRDNTGRWLDAELYGDNLDRMLWAYRQCVKTAAPVVVREAVLFATREWVVVEVILLPLGDDDSEVATILVGLDTIELDVEKPKRGTSFLLNWQK